MQHIALTSGCDSINFERKKKEGDTLGMNGAVPLRGRGERGRGGEAQPSRTPSVPRFITRKL